MTATRQCSDSGGSRSSRQTLVDWKQQAACGGKRLRGQGSAAGWLTLSHHSSLTCYSLPTYIPSFSPRGPLRLGPPPRLRLLQETAHKTPERWRSLAHGCASGHTAGRAMAERWRQACVSSLGLSAHDARHCPRPLCPPSYLAPLRPWSFDRPSGCGFLRALSLFAGRHEQAMAATRLEPRQARRHTTPDTSGN